jgi:hypothetical protein
MSTFYTSSVFRNVLHHFLFDILPFVRYENDGSSCTFAVSEKQNHMPKFAFGIHLSVLGLVYQY